MVHENFRSCITFGVDSRTFASIYEGNYDAIQSSAATATQAFRNVVLINNTMGITADGYVTLIASLITSLIAIIVSIIGIFYPKLQASPAEHHHHRHFYNNHFPYRPTTPKSTTGTAYYHYTSKYSYYTASRPA